MIHFRSLFKCTSSKITNIYQQRNLCKFTFDWPNISFGIVSTAIDSFNFDASRHSNDVRYAVPPSSVENS